jgi:hypothetical protein
MKRLPDGTYLAGDTPVLFALGALVIALTFALAAWRRYEARQIDAELVALIGLALAAVAGAFAVPRTRFVFDTVTRQIRWDSRSLFKENTGMLSFDDVQAVELQSMVTSKGVPTYRVALRTSGQAIPMAAEYSGNRVLVQQLADAVRNVIGSPAQTQ